MSSLVLFDVRRSFTRSHSAVEKQKLPGDRGQSNDNRDTDRNFDRDTGRHGDQGHQLERERDPRPLAAAGGAAARAAPRRRLPAGDALRRQPLPLRQTARPRLRGPSQPRPAQRRRRDPDPRRPRDRVPQQRARPQPLARRGPLAAGDDRRPGDQLRVRAGGVAGRRERTDQARVPRGDRPPPLRRSRARV